MRSIRLIGLLFLGFLASCKSPPTCQDHFVDGAAPVITKPSLASKTTLLCFESYAVVASGVSRTPLWSAEHLTAGNVEKAKQLKRVNRFHAEPQLPAAERAELADYVRSGFDRGHMSPSGDMPTENAQHESFSLANMVPQNPNNNQNLWAGIEAATRTLAQQEGAVYVVTGPMFEGTALERLNGRVLVPTALYKAIYDPKRHAAAAYVTPNAPGMTYQTVSIAALEQRIGIDLFPKLPQQVKEVKMPLPTPLPHNSRRGRNVPTEVD